MRYIYLLIKIDIFKTSVYLFSSEVAQGISDDSYGLIFGLNRFIALVLQSSLTFIVTDEKGLALDERPQFFVYGIYFCVLGVIFGIASVFAFQRFRENMTEGIEPGDHNKIESQEDERYLSEGEINEL